MSLDNQSVWTRGTEETERTPDDRDPILEVRNTSVTFDMTRGKSRVLDGVSLDIYRDEILGIVGESGSGKSMFASALLNAVVNPGQLRGQITYYPDESEPIDLLSLGDRDLKRLRWEEISMVFQGAMSSFNPTMTIRGHFEETLEAHNQNVDSGMDHARTLLRDLYLDPDRVLDRYPHELSGGMTQRALIALSLVLEPNVLVMDEPTAALDLLMQQSILTLLERLQEKYDLTVVFITHDLPLVAGLADRLAVMYAFEFAEIGQTDEILRNAAHPYTRSLLKAVPNLDASLTEMQPIEGSSPDPVHIPTGCSYHPRCPLADETCSDVPPEFYTVSDEHEAACHYWDDAAEAIPYSLSTTSTDGEPEQSEGFLIYSDSNSDVPLDRASPVISIEDVSVHFDQSSGIIDRLLGRGTGHQTVHAVDDVSLDIYENDVVALVGESGCGKTTLGKTAIGLQRPTNGSLKYRGQDVWDTKDGAGEGEFSYDQIRRSLQIIHQDPGSSLNPNQRVMKSLSAPLKRWQSGLTREDRRARVLGMLEHVGMTPAEDYADRYPHQLSGGEKQRIALVRALLMNPDVILADEAVSALDVSLRVEMMDLLLDLQEEFDTSFVFISHNLSNARYLAQNAGGRIGIMYLGELVEIGPAEEVLQNPRHPYTKILKWATAELDPDQAGADEPPVRTVDIPDPVNPPSGCRFHTRCPNAREACTGQKPGLLNRSEDTETHVASCFRQYPEGQHEYWETAPLEGVPEVEHILD